MSQLVQELVTGYKSMATKGVTLAHALGPHVPTEACMDPLRVKQIMANGLTNALKHTKEGAVTLQVGCARHSESLRLLSLSLCIRYPRAMGPFSSIIVCIMIQ